MRSILLLAGIIVLIGGTLLLMKNDEPENELIENEVPTTIPSESDTEAADDTDTEMTRSEIEVTAGSDVGMEFPDMDMTIPVDAKIFDISGRDSIFSVREIRVREGDMVTINFTSEDEAYDFVIDEFDAKTARVQMGGSSSVTFVAEEKGTFEYYSSVGDDRENGMVGTLIVE